MALPDALNELMVIKYAVFHEEQILTSALLLLEKKTREVENKTVECRDFG